MSAECGEPGPEGPQGPSPGPGGLPGASGLGQCPPRTTSAPWSLPLWRAHAAAAVLCYVNLLNYMHWFIIPGVLLDVQKFFQISDSCAGLLQTVFIGCLLLSAPVFGYLGDRHSRKATLSIGILLWSGAGLSSSFISPQYSWLFFLSRGVVGTGSASYSTIAPTILGDLFVRDQRTRVLAIFYIFIPVGSGLGYMLGSAVLQLTGNWHWALRLELCVVHPWGDCHRLCDWSSGLLGPQISVRGPCGAWTAASLPPGAVQQPGQPDFWGADCRDWHHWSCPGSRGFQEVQESQPSGRAPPLRRQPSGRSPLPLPGSHPGPDHVPGLLCAPGPRGAASVLQLGGGCRHPAVRGGAQVPGDSRGFADHSGPHPGGCQQPLPYWTGVQHPEGWAPRLLPAGLPQPPAEFPVLCICHCPGRGLLPADGAVPGVGPGPGPGAWHRDPGRRGHGEASPAFWRGRRHRGPLRPPPSCPPPCTPPSGRRSIRALFPSGCGSGPPAELHLSFLPSQPESWQGLWRELSCQRLRREAWACAHPAPDPQPGWLPVGPE
ncbi:protein spinster homolog 3 isoform X2 [Neofelis nebulosa]|uniref:protein spinster homolog 3 isoform X2 n=1 Tax=Neofelis nebulosa TaxID=61452 RepID=UPI00272951F5|nr:protein spinster homolog 3 isoform X2 [Neofelis nebulosa]